MLNKQRARLLILNLQFTYELPPKHFENNAINEGKAQIWLPQPALF
jgi:hypothetical protein